MIAVDTDGNVPDHPLDDLLQLNVAASLAHKRISVFPEEDDDFLPGENFDVCPL